MLTSIIFIFILCISNSYCSPKIKCLSDHVQRQTRSKSFTSRSSRQTVSVQFQDEAVFKIFNYKNGTYSDFIFTAQYITQLQSGSDLVFWVKGKKSPTGSELSLSDWHSDRPNLLNSTKVNDSTALNDLQSDRYKVLTQLAKTLKYEIIPKMEVVTSKISDHESARFSGIHILLYDIEDTFEQDESFFGGYLDPNDQDSSPNGPLNLLHMDIYPMSPGGRPSPAKVSQKDFYHTITHELFHLYHYRKTKELGKSWTLILSWLKEGLAQLAVYEFLKDSLFYGTSEKILDTSIDYVAQLPSYFEFKSPISIFDNIFENYGLSYIWYPFLLEKKQENERVKLFTDLMQNTDCTIVNTQLCTNGISKTLTENGLELNEQLALFSIAQYYNHEGLNLNSISSSTYTSLAKLNTETAILVSSMSFLELEPKNNYQISYHPIINDSEQYKSINFSASTSFVLIKYPTSSVIESCKSSNDFQRCFLGLGTDHIFFEGKSIDLHLLPQEQINLIYFFIGHPNGDRDKHFITSKVIKSHNFENSPYFESRPKLQIVSNSLYMEFKINRGTFNTLYPKFELKPFSFKNNRILNIDTNDFKISYRGDNTYSLWVYTDGKIGSLNGLNFNLSLNDHQNKKIGEEFNFSFSSSHPLQIESYEQIFYEGWNSLAVYPSKNNQTISEYIDLNLSKLDINDCIYTYVNFSFHNLKTDFNNCSSIASTVSTNYLDNGLGLYIKSNAKTELVLTRKKLARSKIVLTKGWNFKSLSHHSKAKEFHQSGAVAVSYGYNGETRLWDRVSNFGENSPLISGQEIIDLNPYRGFFIYSLQEHIYYSY